jgi:hypothetical protein
MHKKLWWHLWWGLAESAFGGSLELGGGFWQECGLNRRKDVFTSYFTGPRKYYKFRAFNIICKDNAAIKYITVQHKKVSFPSNVTDHTMLAIKQQTKNCETMTPDTGGKF